MPYVLDIRAGRESDILDIARVCESAFGDSRDNAMNFEKQVLNQLVENHMWDY